MPVPRCAGVRALGRRAVPSPFAGEAPSCSLLRVSSSRMDRGSSPRSPERLSRDPRGPGGPSRTRRRDGPSVTGRSPASSSAARSRPHLRSRLRPPLRPGRWALAQPRPRPCSPGGALGGPLRVLKTSPADRSHHPRQASPADPRPPPLPRLQPLLRHAPAASPTTPSASSPAASPGPSSAVSRHIPVPVPPAVRRAGPSPASSQRARRASGPHRGARPRCPSPAGGSGPPSRRSRRGPPALRSAERGRPSSVRVPVAADHRRI